VRETSKDNEEFKFTPFEQGLKQSVDWFIENYHQARIGGRGKRDEGGKAVAAAS
jgi:hypothetical protein